MSLDTSHGFNFITIYDCNQ
ncbi:CRISPR-associated DxTHG motif protein [bacterium]|nr:CRISPR-associated DxTHG motif protein [bacterium]